MNSPAFNNTQITEAGLVHLKGLTSLRRLKLDNTQITDAGVAKFKEALPDSGLFGGITIVRD